MTNTDPQAVSALLSNDTAKVKYEAGVLKVGDYNSVPAVGRITNFSYYDWWDWYPRYAPYTTTIVKTEPSRFEQAFKIVSKLMERGHIQELTVKEFTKLVEEVAEELK